MLEEVFNPQNYYWNPWAIPTLISSIYCFLLGGFTYLKNKKLEGIAILLNNIFVGIWQLGFTIMYSSKVPNIAFFWDKFTYLGVSFISVSSYFFTVSFIKKNEENKFVFLGYVVMAVFFFLTILTNKVVAYPPYKYFWGYYTKYGFLHHPFLLVWGIFVLKGTINLYQGYKKTDLIIKRKQIRLILLSYIFGYIGAVDYLPGFGVEIYPFGCLFISVFLTIFAYAVIRYRAMEIDTVIHQTLLWASTVLLLIFPAALIEIFLIQREIVSPVNLLVNLLLASIYLSLFVGYYNRLRPHIDHLFRRRKYDYQTILGKVAEKIATTINIEDLARQFLVEIGEAMYLRNSVLYVLSKEERSYSVIGRRGHREVDGVKQPSALEIYTEEERAKLPESFRELSDSNPIFKWLIDYRGIIEKEQVEIDPQYQRIKQEALKWFIEQEIELIVPLVFENKVTAFLGLGKKENLQAYTVKDLELLKKLGEEAGVTVFNALHHEDLVEKERLEEEMKMGRQIQIALLPQEVPQISGLIVQGLMQPAKEIGGDYYDFITLPDRDKLAIVIGDVSGKGVAAGLLMAMAKTAIHTLSQEEVSPKQVLLKTNQILSRHIGGRKFMTLLYLLWHPRTKSFIYSAAGHEHILIFRITTGEIEVIMSGGFMLGMLGNIEAFLEEKQIQLNPKDKMLLYTDGVTEAESQTGDRLGLDRLKEVFKKHSHKSVSELMQAIKHEVYAFIGNYPQYDDITLIALEAQ